MNEKIIQFIQENLNKLTNKKFSKKYIFLNIFPIISYILDSNKKKFLIAGSQGIGKSTLMIVLEKTFISFYNIKILNLSLDDYYLKKKERVILSNKIHPLFITRGVPGTHDINMILKTIKDFDKSKKIKSLPIFNKLTDDRSKKKKLLNKKYDILILEGWCCGGTKINDKYLFKNINDLEKKYDKNYSWRNYYNNKLGNEYEDLFKLFDKKIFLKAPSFNYIKLWRYKQEKMLNKKFKKNKGMNKIDIVYFISHFEKITKWMMKSLEHKADLVIKIDRNQSIKNIKYN